MKPTVAEVEALAVYTVHHSDCVLLHPYAKRGAQCSCGLDAALVAASRLAAHRSTPATPPSARVAPDASKMESLSGPSGAGGSAGTNVGQSPNPAVDPLSIWYARAKQAEARAEAAEKDAARLRKWLDNNTTFYDVDADYPVEGNNIPTLAQVSNRIWYHATDDVESYPFSAAIDAALASVAGTEGEKP